MKWFPTGFDVNSKKTQINKMFLISNKSSHISHDLRLVCSESNHQAHVLSFFVYNPQVFRSMTPLKRVPSLRWYKPKFNEKFK